MSTAITAAPHRDTARTEPRGSGRPAARLVSGQLALVFLAEFCALTSFYLLLSVAPMYASGAGAGSTGAGLVTGVLLLGTVAAELAAPALMRRFGCPSLLAVGLMLLGVPSLALLTRNGFAVVVSISLIRGFGFGLGTVVTGALTARLVPPARRGEGLGLFGVVATAPAVVALPAGVWLAGHSGLAIVAGAAAAVAVVPLTVLRRAGDGRAAPSPASTASQPGTAAAGLVGSLRRGGQMRPFLVFATSAMAGGVVVSFLPIATGVPGSVATAGLLGQALAATASRWWAGRAGDRHGHDRLLVPALLLSAAGMVALVRLGSPVAVITGMCLFGTGFGISQNATFALMTGRMPATGLGTASALWNLAYDSGYGAGPAVFGLLVGHTGYPAAFAGVGAVMLAVLPAARGKPGCSRPRPPVPGRCTPSARRVVPPACASADWAPARMSGN